MAISPKAIDFSAMGPDIAAQELASLDFGHPSGAHDNNCSTRERQQAKISGSNNLVYQNTRAPNYRCAKIHGQTISNAEVRDNDNDVGMAPDSTSLGIRDVQLGYFRPRFDSGGMI